MVIDLGHLEPAPGSQKKKKRVGRGDGSGHGKTACRGHKGQGARSGGGTPPGFEGGQMPLKRRLPKRGFRNPFRKSAAIVNLGQLEIFPSGSEVTPDLLLARGFIAGKDRSVKILAGGPLSKSLTVKAHAFSSKARERLEALGGKAELIAAHD